MNKPKVFSGIRPSGDIQIGNYLGAIQQWIELQKTSDCIFAVADYHAITTPFTPEQLVKGSIEIAKWLLAADIDPDKSAIILQSQIPEHTELAWILSCLTPLGELQRMTQFKEKSQGQKSSLNAGLLIYPVLMAADVLLYQTDIVPVGEDQKQHLELTRSIAKRFNNRFGEVFTIPKAQLSDSARIMSLKDPSKKMSKTGDSGIVLSDSAQEIKRKIMAAVTDEKPTDKMSPGVKNLFSLLKAFAPEKERELEEKYYNKSLKYVELKETLAQTISHHLQPIQEKYQKITDEEIKSIFEKSRIRIQPQAQKTLQKVKKAIGVL
jgi:tryptophanyl-tRNA synthetase